MSRGSESSSFLPKAAVSTALGLGTLGTGLGMYATSDLWTDSAVERLANQHGLGANDMAEYVADQSLLGRLHSTEGAPTLAELLEQTGYKFPQVESANNDTAPDLGALHAKPITQKTAVSPVDDGLNEKITHNPKVEGRFTQHLNLFARSGKEVWHFTEPPVDDFWTNAIVEDLGDDMETKTVYVSLPNGQVKKYEIMPALEEYRSDKQKVEYAERFKETQNAIGSRVQPEKPGPGEIILNQNHSQVNSRAVSYMDRDGNLVYS